MLVEVGALRLNGLREKPARAAARAAAPHFYAVRAQRRHLRNQQLGTGMRRVGRARPYRLRDRLRAVSHRVRCLGQAVACDERGDDESESALRDSGGIKIRGKLIPPDQSLDLRLTLSISPQHIRVFSVPPL